MLSLTALLALQLTHALHLTRAPAIRRRRVTCKGTKLTSDYVESLFDGFADTFEGVLVEQLEYCAPQKVAEAAINATAHRGKYASALDAGCGTGLAGLELRDAVQAGDLQTGLATNPELAGSSVMSGITSAPRSVVKPERARPVLHGKPRLRLIGLCE